MKKAYYAKLDTYSVVQGEIELVRTTLSQIDFFDERDLAFNSAVKVITDYAPQQVYANVADMERYRKDRDLLVDAISTLSTKLVSYAGKAKDNALREDVAYSIRELERMRKPKLLLVAKVLLERANKVLLSGAIPQLTPELIEAVSQPLTSIVKWKDARRIQQLKSRTDSRFLENAFTVADEALSDLFLSINELKHSDIDLFKRLDDAATNVITKRTLSVKGMVAEAKTEYPIKGVKLLIRRLDDTVPNDLMVTTPDVVKQSAEKGGFYLQSLPEGTYLLTASKLGYSTTNVEFNVVPAETTRVSVLLVAS